MLKSLAILKVLAICTKGFEAHLQPKPLNFCESLLKHHHRNYLPSQPFNDLQIEVVPLILIHVLSQTLCSAQLYLKDLFAKSI